MVNFSTLSSLFLSLFISNGELPADKISSSPVEINIVNAANAGVLIDDFADESRIYNWWDSNPENWERKWDREKEVLVVKCKNVGKDYDCFGKQFDPIDFSQTPVLKVRMKYEGETAPKVRINLKDYDGKTNNEKNIVKTLKSGDFQDYYFDFSNTWKQSWPDNDVVDPIEIVEVLFFINPGAADYNGTISIDHIEAISAADAPKE